MLANRSSQQIWLPPRRQRYLVEMPHAARLAPRRFGTMSELGGEYFAAADRFVRDHDTMLEQQFLNVA